jgi:hypothetical protein
MRRVNVRKGKVPTSREQWKLEKYILKRLQKNPMTSTELLQEFEFGTVSEFTSAWFSNKTYRTEQGRSATYKGEE